MMNASEFIDRIIGLTNFGGGQNFPNFVVGTIDVPAPVPVAPSAMPISTTTSTQPENGLGNTVLPETPSPPIPIISTPSTTSTPISLPPPPFGIPQPFVPNRVPIIISLPPTTQGSVPITSVPTTATTPTTVTAQPPTPPEPETLPFIPNINPIPIPIPAPSPVSTLPPSVNATEPEIAGFIPNQFTILPTITGNSTIPNMPGGRESILSNSSSFPAMESSSEVSGTITILCGNPGFCENGVYQQCGNTPINDCERCDVGLAATFLFFAIFLGSAIMLGNLLIILISYRRHKNGKANKMDFCKISLALADMLTGFHILTVVVYNFSWTINATANQLIDYEHESRSLPEAFFGGMFYLFGFTASVYHLSFMAALRLFAVLKPLQFKFMRNRTVGYILVLIWVLSAVAATSPGWFPEQLFFAYQVSLLLFFPTAGSIADISPALGILAMFYIIPYILVTLLSVATGIAIRYRQRSKQKLFSNQPAQKTAQFVAKDELAVLLTIVIMQFAFTIAIIPTILVVALFYAEILQCNTLTTPYIVAAYFSMTNSLVNVFIYNIREKTFRLATKKMLCSCIPEHFWREVVAKTSSFPLRATKPTNSTELSSSTQPARSKIASSSVESQR